MTEEILDYGRNKDFRQQTLDRWLRLAEPARAALLELARELKIGENHFRDIVDWMEEISLRDGVALSEILKGGTVSQILSDPRLGRSDKLKRLKEDLRQRRFPRLARIEGEIRDRIRELRVPPRIQISVPPGLEGGVLTVQIKSGSSLELKSFVEELGRVVETEPMKRIFDLLGGAEA